MHGPIAAAKWTAFLPRQIQRTAAPLCGIVMLLLCFISSFGPSEHDTYHWEIPQHEKFPRRIWQTWKVNPFGFDERDHTVAKTWPQKNPGHRYEVLTDQNDLYYVESHFGPAGLNRPDIVYTYKSLTAKIIKADLLRYLIMYVEGGLYADIDVEALRPIERFIPSRFEEKEIDMVIGIEVDQPEFKDHSILGPKSMSFCQWTFMCKPKVPVMLQLIDNIIAWINDIAREQQVPISEVKLDFDAVLSGTGPSAFTRAILSYMSSKTGYPITWDTFHAMDESKLVGGVLVLTVEAFAAGQGHSDSGNHNAKQALVKHHYHASKWPTNHPRYKHPVFGEVELCNWVDECVKQWDENVATFRLLPVEEQQKQIAAQEAINGAQAGLTIQGLGDLKGLPMSPGEPGIPYQPPVQIPNEFGDSNQQL
ncbi:hypothetical protein H2198_005216 [Neophaeococcomyces mojaviensis]|uniref:Uncharacterized protein n=1 Tax=Neophaeococcomyces mojaviensis TaxID=3383035 RepID=A0ACC3A749_9EURO|nr:hypothetical protein H2198_005216 [Knufia sp. JES_112]